MSHQLKIKKIALAALALPSLALLASIEVRGATSTSTTASPSDSYAADDSHNHDGSHPEGAGDCGTNYMLPGVKARLGSHSFLILGQEDATHILADHRSGTPPHNYHYILRIHLKPEEMAAYKKLESVSKRTPAFTTIYFDDKDSKKQLDRTFFCLSDLNRIFGSEKKANDGFDGLFPIRASFQKDADFEGAFEIEKSIFPGTHLSLQRKDIELVINRYLPSYLEQQAFRKAIKEHPQAVVPLLSDTPLYATESVESAHQHRSYARTDGAIAEVGATCPSDFYLKNVNPPKTIHSFLLLAELDPTTILATHLYDQSPHNFQTELKLKVTSEQMKLYRTAKAESQTPPLLQTRWIANGTTPEKNFYFCMADFKKIIASPGFQLQGTIFKNSNLNDYELGSPVGKISVSGKNISVMTNRNLLSLMDPIAIAKSTLGDKFQPATNESDVPPSFVDIQKINPRILVEMRYSTPWNFTGNVVNGYRANRCYLTKEAAQALSKIQEHVMKEGLSLLAFDCYRPQRAVDAFVQWARDVSDVKMKSIFYPSEDKSQLFERGYIAEKSGHSRGSTIDLTLVRTSKPKPQASAEKLAFQEAAVDCRSQRDIVQTGQLDMGTTFDCFSPLAYTAAPTITNEVRNNRDTLVSVMKAEGFVNYSKEWWHFTLKNEPFKTESFDFEIR